MPFGIHTFYVFPRVANAVANQEAYMIGKYIGDHYNDEAFGEKIKKITQKLASVFGWGGFAYYWSPGNVKPYKPRTEQQRYQTAVTKTYNKHKKRVLEIINANTLFVDDFLAEETAKLYNRIEILKKRYNQVP